MPALVTGATGLIGRALCPRLDAPHVLSRNPDSARAKLGEVRAFGWPDLTAGPPPAEALAGVDRVFHLAGEPVAEGRWTKAKKERIRASRELGTRQLVAGLAQLEERPKVLVSASAVGYYGDGGDAVLDEDAPAGEDFLAEVCVAWEDEARKAEALGIRVVLLRIGIVLGPGGGALSKMLTPFRMGVGGRIGSGRQYMPWVHVDDVVGLMLFAADNDDLRGPLNTAPDPVTNRDFTKTLGRVLRRPTIFPVPGFGLKMLFGEFAGALLASQRTSCAKAKEAGYRFEYSELEGALRASL